MPKTLQCSLQFALALVASGFTLSQALPPAKAQEAGWITLFDGKDLEQWDQVGKSNWHLADGTVIADKMEDKEAGYLVSKKPYKDFVLRVEFWSSDDANSGIYFRCLDAKKITDRTCYEANIFDQRPDPSYGTGAITRYSRSIGCRKPAANGIRSRSRRRGATSRSCSTDRKRPNCGTECSMKGRSPCNTARERSNSVRWRSSLCKAGSRYGTRLQHRKLSIRRMSPLGNEQRSRWGRAMSG